jgi:hypothetical protein
MTPIHTRRRAALLLGAMPLLAACPGQDLSSLDPPAPPPVADALPAPDAWSLPPGTPVDGRLSATLGRGGVARGTLETNGQRLPVTLAGLAVEGGRGGTIEGEVYGLDRAADFAGSYRLVGTGSAVGESAMLGGLSLGNANQVLLRLRLRGGGMAVLSLPQGSMTAALGR